MLNGFKDHMFDNTNSIERVREIFKVPSGDLHKNLLKLVIADFNKLDTVFHLQFLIILVKELNMKEKIKLGLREKELED